MRTIPQREAATEIGFAGRPVGLLTPQELPPGRQGLRLTVTDFRYRILDGSSFPNATLAQRAVRQLAPFVTLDAPANDA